jgi:hypothetical protein
MNTAGLNFTLDVSVFVLEVGVNRSSRGPLVVVLAETQYVEKFLGQA